MIAGVGAVTTRAAIEKAKAAERARADAIYTVAPYFISPTPDELYRHLRTIAEATSLPVLLYNLLTRAHISILPHTLGRLAHIESIVGITDFSGNQSLTTGYIRHTPDDFSAINGNGAVSSCPLVPTMIAEARRGSNSYCEHRAPTGRQHISKHGY